MADLGKSFRRGTRNALGRALGCLQVEVLSLEAHELSPQSVILGIADDRIVKHVVAVGMVANRRAQRFKACLYVCHCLVTTHPLLRSNSEPRTTLAEPGTKSYYTRLAARSKAPNQT